MINIILVSVYFEVFFTYHLLFEKNLTKVSIYFSKNSLFLAASLTQKITEGGYSSILDTQLGGRLDTQSQEEHCIHNRTSP